MMDKSGIFRSIVIEYEWTLKQVKKNHKKVEAKLKDCLKRFLSEEECTPNSLLNTHCSNSLYSRVRKGRNEDSKDFKETSNSSCRHYLPTSNKYVKRQKESIKRKTDQNAFSNNIGLFTEKSILDPNSFTHENKDIYQVEANPIINIQALISERKSYHDQIAKLYLSLLINEKPRIHRHVSLQSNPSKIGKDETMINEIPDTGDLFVTSNIAAATIEGTIRKAFNLHTSSNESTSNKLIKLKGLRPRLIWFDHEETLSVDWRTLQKFVREDFSIIKELAQLKSEGKFTKYVKLVENILSSNLVEDVEVNDLEQINILWRQLLFICICFANKCAREKKYSAALEILDRASIYALDRKINSNYIAASINLSYAKYYTIRNKANAALQYVNKALKTFSIDKEWTSYTECCLHKSYILWKLGRCTAATKQSWIAISMIRDEKMAIQTHKERVIFVVAMHNIAVQFFSIGKITDAYISIEKACRIAQLSKNHGDSTNPNILATYQICLYRFVESFSFN